MTNEKKAFLIVLIVVAATATFFAVKAMISIFKNPSLKQPRPDSSTPITTNDKRIGQTAYANSDDVIVMNNDFTIYKFAKKGEWVGKVYAIGENNYTVSGNRFVLQGDVYLV